jgi:hypothetical protein
MGIEAEHDEVLSFIENHRLMGKGLGYVDAHLITAATNSHEEVTFVPMTEICNKFIND